MQPFGCPGDDTTTETVVWAPQPHLGLFYPFLLYCALEFNSVQSREEAAADPALAMGDAGDKELARANKIMGSKWVADVRDLHVVLRQWDS